MHCADAAERSWLRNSIEVAADLKNFVVEAVRGGQHFQDTYGDFCIDNLLLMEGNCSEECSNTLLKPSHLFHIEHYYPESATCS